MVISDFL